MKPNLLVVQPSQHDSDPAIDRFCESLAESHYVYLVRPLSGFREDSPAGVRFLNFSPERLPGFGEVETVIIVDSTELEGRIREEYPTARHWHMDSRAGVDFAMPGLETGDTIIDGRFGPDSYQERAQAV